MTRVVLWLAVAITVLAASSTTAQASSNSLSPTTILRLADESMSATRSLHELMGKQYPRRFYRLDRGHPEAMLALWKGRLHRARRAERQPPHLNDWLCIHRYEGSWTDPGAPYYGGLQMDWGFMAAYGGRLLSSKGTADRWTPLEQMWVAERALRAGRGFWPWPNTARMCGLI